MSAASGRNAVNAWMARLDEELHKDTALKPYLDILEAKTGVKRSYLASGAIGIVALILVFASFAELVCNAIGFVYPAYQSLAALETSSKEDDRKWLIYWVGFAAFSIVEFFSDSVISFLPLYWLAKCLLLIWLSFPGPMNGSQLIYNKVLRPYFLKHRGQIDQQIHKAANLVSGKSD